MASGLPSDEVAEDYKNALDDLVTNDRYQIANLTMIAKENIEHAEAISRVLTNHINRASPSRKLPALYVLDSLVKNIGSPYTVYFGRNLHSTFMLAYSQVDAAIRRKLEEMLRTWREPIPGSLSTTPVFPLQSTQSIVDTLNRYKASTASSTVRPQSNTPLGNKAPVLQPYRNTPTPPQLAGLPLYGSLTPQNPLSHHSSLQVPYQAQDVSIQRPRSQQDANDVQTNRVASNSVDLSKLHADIDDLTTDAKIECATHPMDSAAQRKLTTLQTLKELLDSGTTSEQDLVDIRNTIRQEMDKKIATQQATNSTIQHLGISSYSTNTQLQQQSQPQYQLAPSVAPPAFINQANLAELLRMTSNAHSTPPPQPTSFLGQTFPASYSTPPVVPAVPASIPQVMPQIPTATIPLLEQLRASGILSSTPTPTQNMGQALGFLATDLVLTSASIRFNRPQMVTSFLDERPNQCSTCGRRFTSDEVGKEKKVRHLDWHFRTKKRMPDAEMRGQNRSWYIDERDWITNKDVEDDAGIDDNITVNGQALAPASEHQDFVLAPSDSASRNALCPIDQEPFKLEYSDKLSEFIWKDAIKVGERYYHASCYREVIKVDKPSSSTATYNGTHRIATPDSVLGKRKAEDINMIARSKIKLEM